MNDTKTKAASERTVTVVPMAAPLPRRKRVAAYARVSVEKDSMLHSLAAQVSYYNGLIRKHSEWEYAGVYADEGLTGTKESRPEFQRLLKDCRAGKIDLILVKSISRLARNTVTMLSTVRELKELGIDVYFEKENIHSMSGDGELMLSILASFAQEESLSVSENQKWRIQKNFKEGIPVGTFIYGYKMKDGTFTVIPEQAEVIRDIFSMFLDGLGRVAIAERLNERGIPAPKGGAWGPGMLYDLLRNEKYVGDLLLQKYYVKDHLSKKLRPNKGEKPQYYVQDDHPAIVDRDTFERVQAELAIRAEKYSVEEDKPLDESKLRPDGKYLFSGKITCGVCGKTFNRKIGNAGSPYANPIWLCSAYSIYGKKACESKRISEATLVPIVCEVLNTTEERLADEMNRIDGITAYPDGRITFDIGGTTIERAWGNAPRSQSWNAENRQRASDQMKETWKRRKSK